MNKIQTLKTVGLAGAAFVLVAGCTKGWKEEKKLSATGDWAKESNASAATVAYADSTFTFTSTTATNGEINAGAQVYTNFTGSNTRDDNKKFKQSRVSFSLQLSSAWANSEYTGSSFRDLASVTIFYNNTEGKATYQQIFEVVSTGGGIYLSTGYETTLHEKIQTLSEAEKNDIKTWVDASAQQSKIKKVTAADQWYTFEIEITNKNKKPVSKTTIKTGTADVIKIDEVAFIPLTDAPTLKDVGGLRSLAITKVHKYDEVNAKSFSNALKAKDIKLEYKG